jgi:hypothetical protein
MAGTVYEIRVQGQLDAHWAEWFEGLALSHGPEGTTLLTGPVADGAALFGLLERVRDLGLTLLAVNRMEDGVFVGGKAAPQVVEKIPESE